MTTEVIKVQGMTWGHCKMAVESAVKSLSGVSSVEVNLDQQTAKIVFDDAKTNLEQVRASIKDAGYEPQ